MAEFEKMLALQCREVNKNLADICTILTDISKNLSFIDDSIRFFTEELTHKNGIPVPSVEQEKKEQDLMKKKVKNV